VDLIPKWLPRKGPPWLYDPGPPRLWKIGYALAACFAVAVIGLAGLWWVALALLGHPKRPHSEVISLHDTVGVAQLVFASVAGAGALVALIVAYRRQRVAETTASLDRERWQVTSAHDRTRLLNERFTTIAGQLGDDQPAVRLAGVHAMAGLADDWEENRQTCIDVLCAYLRMPYEPDPGEEAPAPERLAFRASREVRHTVIRVITAHLTDGSAVSWQSLNFDFTGVVFDGGIFRAAKFSGGEVSFVDAEFSGGTVIFGGSEFSGGTVSFRNAKFSGSTVSFGNAKFSGGTVSFGNAKFSGGTVSFNGAEFSADAVSFYGAEFSGGEVSFGNAKFSGGTVSFGNAEFSGGTVSFRNAKFSGSTVSFGNAKFSGGTVSFGNAKFSGGEVSFNGAEFSGGTVSFCSAEFSGGEVVFYGAEFSGGTVSFSFAEFSGGTVSFNSAEFSGGEVSFNGAKFSGGTVDFSRVTDWSHPPRFDWTGAPPAGVELPRVTR
jgi:uncharacterized protein YjbI with pentapeptide repeats